MLPPLLLLLELLLLLLMMIMGLLRLAAAARFDRPIAAHPAAARRTLRPALLGDRRA